LISTTTQCYIGKKQLDKAVELYCKVYPGGKDDVFTIFWLPFYLDPTASEKGMPFLEHFQQRFGPDKAAPMQDRLRSVGSQHGINFSFAGKTGRTRDSHRLIELAGRKGAAVQNAVVLQLFQSYFEADGDITALDTLLEAGVKGGLDRAEVRDWLETGEGGGQVDKEVEEAKEKGIHGVPHFTIQGKYVVDGAQDPQDFLEVFVRVKETEAAQSETDS
jgi:predicted DsbA family dithiol-disulfide isomerase